MRAKERQSAALSLKPGSPQAPALRRSDSEGMEFTIRKPVCTCSDVQSAGWLRVRALAKLLALAYVRH